MSRYLTNTSLSNEQLCQEAARISGYDIRFEREPMPYDGSFEDENYNREALIGIYGCVVNYDERLDCSPFWRVWDNLKERSY